MKVFSKISNLFSNKLFKSKEVVKQDIDVEQMLQGLDEIEKEKDNKIIISKRTIIAKLYSLEQTISVLNPKFKEAYDSFKNEIDDMRSRYIEELEESGKDLTFEIDPDINIKKLSEVSMLEGKINKFIQEDFRFGNLVNSFGALILKLNELYNVSIYTTGEENKVLMQLKNGSNAQEKLVNELKSYEFILKNKSEREEMITLILYTDYMIFKTKLKNGNYLIEDLLIDLISAKEFEGLDINEAFKNYILDELNNLQELAQKITNSAVKRKLLKEIGNFNSTIVYNTEELITDETIWNNLFRLEKQIIDLLLSSGISKDEAKVKVLSSFTFNINQEDLYVSPRTNAIISLSSIYSGVLQTKAAIALKLLNNLSDNVSYKELYFIFLLLDILDGIEENDDELSNNFEKYKSKYNYSRAEIKEKNEMLKNRYNNSYIFVFSLTDVEKKGMTQALNRLGLDYKLDKDNILFNDFYFKDMKNVMKDLK